MKNFSVSVKKATVIIASGFLLGANFLWVTATDAASLSATDLRLNRMSSATATSARLIFRTSASITGTSMTIAMNGGDTTTWIGAGGLVNATQTISSASCVADTPGATALPGSLTASGTSGTITVSGVTTLAASTLYCADLTSASALTTPSAGEYHPVITVGSDSSTVAVRVVTNDSVVVNAVVPPTFNFVLGGNTDTFTTNLAAGSVVSTGGVTATVNTNAKTGWTVWAKDANAGLTSTVASKTIASTTAGNSATLSAGTEGYVFGVTSITQGTGVGTTAAATAYDATASGGVNNVGGGVDTTLRQVASSTGTASNAVLSLKERAAITSLTPAASDYTDTITLIGSGKF